MAEGCELGSALSHVEHRTITNNYTFALHGPLDLLLLAHGDILSHRLRGSLHGLGSHFQIRQQFPLLASLIEGSVLTDHRLHAAHSGRELRVGDVQFDVGGELAGMAVRAQVVGTRHSHLADRG
jgi:hypothetical protein